MATIRECRSTAKGSSKVTYQALVRLKGYSASAVFERKTDAKQWAAATETLIREGRYFPERAAQRRTLAELLDRYTRDVLPDKRDKASQGPQLAWWRERLGHLALADVTPSAIAEARDELARGPGRRRKPVEKSTDPPPPPPPRSPATVNRYLAALSHVFTVAVREWGWLDDSPMRRVTKKKEPRGRVRFLDDDERGRLLDACDEGPGYLKPVVLLALATGMRKGEILGLRWRDVDISGERGHLILHDTKNGERRGVPLVGPALAALRAWGKVRPLDGAALVFPGTSSIHHAFGRALKRAKLEDFRFHDLRHSAASYLAMAGASPSEIAGVLGHKTLAMVKRYAHLSDAHLGNVLERMSKRFLDGGGA